MLKVWQNNSTRFGTSQIIVVGSNHENPVRLNGMDWIEVPNTYDVPVYPGFKPLYDEEKNGRGLTRRNSINHYLGR